MVLRRIDEWFLGDRRAVRVLLLIGVVNIAILGGLFVSMVFFPERSSDCDAVCREEIRRSIEDIVGKDGNQFNPQDGLNETLE